MEGVGLLAPFRNVSLEPEYTRHKKVKYVLFIVAASILASAIVMRASTVKEIKISSMEIKMDYETHECGPCSFLSLCAMKTIVGMLFSGVNIKIGVFSGIFVFPLVVLVKLWQIVLSACILPLLIFGLLDELFLYIGILITILIINLMTWISVGTIPDNYVWHPVYSCVFS